MADLFLSYHGPDREAVVAIQRLLQARGITTFLDRDDLVRGLPWPEALEAALRSCRGVAVFLGRELGVWQKRELWYALDRQGSEYAQGRPFPVVPVLLPGADSGSGFLFLNTWVDLRAGVDNTTEVDALAESLTASVPTSVRSRTDTGICPYRGLHPFREEDAPFLFGREEATGRLVEKVNTSRLAAVVGSSGCGKSSVVMAGLVPRLRRQRPPSVTWDVVSFTPGRAPLRRLSRSLVAWLEPDLSPVDLTARSEQLGTQFETGQSHPAPFIEQGLHQSGADRLLLIVDQFEELFTEAPISGRRPFARILIDLLRQGPIVPVLTLRADFFGLAIDLDRDFSTLLEVGSITLGPLRRDELRSAIVEPARLVGLTFEPPLLIEKLLDDVGDEPGNLPLLEYALAELWNGRENGKLLENRYSRINGLAGAIAARAEAQLQKLGQLDAVRRVMTSLVRTSPGTSGIENTRRRVVLPDLGEGAREIVNEFSKPGVRLLVTSRDEAGRETVEVAHEALISAWAQLQQWLAHDLELRLWRQRLEPSLHYWEQDASNLLTGLALAEAEKWMHERGPDLLPKEAALVHVSVAKRNEEIAEATRRQQKASAQRMMAIAVPSLATVIALVLVLGFIVGIYLPVNTSILRFNDARNLASVRDTVPGGGERYLRVLLESARLVEETMDRRIFTLVDALRFVPPFTGYKELLEKSSTEPLVNGSLRQLLTSTVWLETAPDDPSSSSVASLQTNYPCETTEGGDIGSSVVGTLVRAAANSSRAILVREEGTADYSLLLFYSAGLTRERCTAGPLFYTVSKRMKPAVVIDSQLDYLVVAQSAPDRELEDTGIFALQWGLDSAKPEVQLKPLPPVTDAAEAKEAADYIRGEVGDTNGVKPVQTWLARAGSVVAVGGKHWRLFASTAVPQQKSDVAPLSQSENEWVPLARPVPGSGCSTREARLKEASQTSNMPVAPLMFEHDSICFELVPYAQGPVGSGPDSEGRANLLWVLNAYTAFQAATLAPDDRSASTLPLASFPLGVFPLVEKRLAIGKSGSQWEGWVALEQPEKDAWLVAPWATSALAALGCEVLAPDQSDEKVPRETLCWPTDNR